MIKLLYNKRGFTLVELLVGMSIMTLIMAGVFGVLSESIRSYQFSQKRVYEAQQSRVAINSIIDDLRNATVITTPEKGITQSSITYTMDSIEYTIGIGVEQNAGKLMKDSTAVTSNIVKSISFARDATDGRILTIRITLYSPDNHFSGDFIIDAAVFATNLSQ